MRLARPYGHALKSMELWTRPTRCGTISIPGGFSSSVWGRCEPSITRNLGSYWVAARIPFQKANDLGNRRADDISLLNWPLFLEAHPLPTPVYLGHNVLTPGSSSMSLCYILISGKFLPVSLWLYSISCYPDNWLDDLSTLTANKWKWGLYSVGSHWPSVGSSAKGFFS